MENLYQNSKVFPQVYPQNQNLHRFTSEKGWVHPGEIHYKDGVIYPEYWAWREKGMGWPHEEFVVRWLQGSQRVHLLSSRITTGGRSEETFRSR